MARDDLWQLERRFWLEGSEIYETFLAPQAVMLFPQTGIIGRADVIDSLRRAPRWTELEIGQPREAESDGAVVLAYQAQASREGQGAYEALCSSTYVEVNARWLMLSHQQTPLGP